MSLTARPTYKSSARLVALPAIVLSVLVIHDAATPAPSYVTAYDGHDPKPCAQGTGNAGPINTVPLKSFDGTVIGQLHLIRSKSCGSLWPQFLLTTAAEKTTRGDRIALAVNRPADNATMPYAVPLSGGRYGYGNMLGDSACVRATGQLLSANGKPQGPVAQTKCLS